MCSTYFNYKKNQKFFKKIKNMRIMNNIRKNNKNLKTNKKIKWCNEI